MQTLKVDLAERAYPIHIGQGLLQQADLIQPHVHGKSVVTVSNTTVAPLYLTATQALLQPFSNRLRFCQMAKLIKRWKL